MATAPETIGTSDPKKLPEDKKCKGRYTRVATQGQFAILQISPASQLNQPKKNDRTPE